MPPHTPPRRNAATTLSMTPYQLKTGSIPTSARIYSAVPLNQDLTNELEGATVVESDKNKGKQHYILHPYDHLPPSQTTAPDPATLTRNNEPLYDLATQSWDPSYLPHILRKSTTSDSNSGSAPAGQGKLVANSKKKKKKKSTNSVPAGRRSLTITREYHSAQGLVTETQDGTYLPKAGSEEQKVAQWLNYLADSLRTHHESSNTEAGPSSRTRGSVKREQRRWSAESSTRAQRVEDTTLHLKPDIALLQAGEYDDAYPAFSWRNIISFLELTSDDFSSRQQLQLSKIAYAIFIAQPGRRFVIALSLANQLLRLHVFDRAGAVFSRGYNIHRTPSFLVRILHTLITGPPESLGHDITLSFSTNISRMHRPRTEPYIFINGKKYIIQSMLFHSAMIRGRATLCFVVIDRTDSRQYVVKDCWTHIGRVTTEEDMLRRIKENDLTCGVPVLEAASTVQILGVDDSTSQRRPSYLFNEGSTPPETRIHRRLLFAPIGEPLTQFSCKQELISVLIDLVDVHERLIHLCCILHRDISINNTLMYFFEGAWPSQAQGIANSAAKLAERDEIIRQRGFRRGLLIDFDYAKFTDDTMAGVSDGHRTGTIPFMSIEILGEYAKQEGVITHEAKHDLESFVYVLIWICVLYGDPRIDGSNPRDVNATCLSEWTSPRSLKQIRSLAIFKRGDLQERVALEEFTDYFEDLKDTVTSLYDALSASNSSGGPALSHATMKKILLDAFFTVTEPSLESVEEFEVRTKRKKRSGDVQLRTTKQRRLQ